MIAYAFTADTLPAAGLITASAVFFIFFDITIPHLFLLI
jgi:hypothetical protein